MKTSATNRLHRREALKRLAAVGTAEKNRALEAKISFTPSAFVIARKTGD